MMIKVSIIGDTHLKAFEELPNGILREITNSDWVIHVGDYTFVDVLNGLINLKGNKFIGVYGNADPQSIRDKVQSKEIIEISGKKIGITHPESGGSSGITESKVLTIFKNENVDVIIYGHTHTPQIIYKNNLLLINPGKGYLESIYYGSPTTMVILEIKDEIHGKIKEIKS
jgi:putative phosphoesterase